MQVVSFKKGDVVFNDGECLEKIHYIEMHKTGPTNSGANVVNRLSDKIDKFDYSKKIRDGFFIIK